MRMVQNLSGGYIDVHRIVVLADRNYAKPKVIAWIVDQGAPVIVRFG